jgi:polysaccharide export outer membrane protein
VRRPGRYEWQPHAHLSSILPSADYLKELPDLGYVLIVRETGPERREQVLSAKLDAAWAAAQGPDDPELRSRDRIIVFGLKEPRGDLLAPVIERLKLQAREDDPQQVVRVGGHIPFPGDYPLESGMRVADLIRAAGGLSEDAYRTEAEIVRYSVVDHQKRQTEVMSVPLAQVIAGDAAANALLQPFDDLQIRPLPAWGERVTVKIEGEVRFPGEYVTYRGDTLGHLVQRAGGLTAQAYPEGAVLLRESLRKEEEEQKRTLQERLRSQIVTASLQQSQLQPDKLQSLQLAQQMLTSLETTKAAGRLVIDLEAQLKAAPGEGVRVQKDDRLFVPQHPQTVSIYGEVNFPTSHLYEQGLSRDDYIRLSGGLTKQADKGRIYVVRANGEVLASGGWFSTGSQQMRPGDTIVVPPDTDSLKSLVVLTSVSQILYQIGLAAAAFHAIGGF